MLVIRSDQFSHSVVSNSFDPMNRSMPGLPVHHQLPELAQTHVHRVGDAIPVCLFTPLLVQQSPSHVRLFVTPWTAAHQASLSFTNFHSLLKLMSIELVMPSNHVILCCSLSPAAFNLSQQQVFSSESALLIRWPKYWSFSFSISPSNEYSGLISFRMNWLDLLAVQGTLKSLL